MIIIVTGNIGCGKSTAVQMMLKKFPEYKLFDFDQTVKGLYADESIKAELLKEFGTCDKAEISKIVHANASGMLRLRSITDDYLIELTHAAATSDPNMILDVPLYFENEHQWGITPDVVICVTADEDVQIKRVMARNGFTEARVREIMAKQLPQDVKSHLSDITIDNTGTLKDLQAQIDALVL